MLLVPNAEEDEAETDDEGDDADEVMPIGGFDVEIQLMLAMH